MTGAIIVLEGADAAGKTTLARELVKRHDARYLHLGPYRDIWRWHLGAYLRAQRLAARGHVVIVDRHWLSECAYGVVYRDGSAYPVGARCFDRLWLRSAALYVLCVPRDAQRQEREHYERNFEAKGNVYSRDRQRAVRAIIARYYDLAYGNIACPGVDYMSQLIRYGDFSPREDVFVYDRHGPRGQRLDDTTDLLVQRAERRRRATYPLALDPTTPNFAGHPAQARFLMVGEMASPSIKRPDLRFPFVDRCTHLSAATWLNRTLHVLAVPEHQLLWVNAHGGPQLEYLARATPLPSTVTAVALGRVAERELERVGWPANRVRTAPHPQHARRFNHHHPDVYVQQLYEALS